MKTMHALIGIILALGAPHASAEPTQRAEALLKEARTRANTLYSDYNRDTASAVREQRLSIYRGLGLDPGLADVIRSLADTRKEHESALAKRAIFAIRTIQHAYDAAALEAKKEGNMALHARIEAEKLRELKAYLLDRNRSVEENLALLTESSRQTDQEITATLAYNIPERAARSLAKDLADDRQLATNRKRYGTYIEIFEKEALPGQKVQFTVRSQLTVNHTIQIEVYDPLGRKVGNNKIDAQPVNGSYETSGTFKTQHDAMPGIYTVQVTGIEEGGKHTWTGLSNRSRAAVKPTFTDGARALAKPTDGHPGSFSGFDHFRVVQHHTAQARSISESRNEKKTLIRHVLSNQSVYSASPSTAPLLRIDQKIKAHSAQ